MLVVAEDSATTAISSNFSSELYAADQTCAVLSAALETRYLPLGDQAMPNTQSE
jgi:hypothetical protein